MNQLHEKDRYNLKESMYERIQMSLISLGRQKKYRLNYNHLCNDTLKLSLSSVTRALKEGKINRRLQ
jgi:hypothetical protein